MHITDCILLKSKYIFHRHLGPPYNVSTCTAPVLEGIALASVPSSGALTNSGEQQAQLGTFLPRPLYSHKNVNIFLIRRKFSRHLSPIFKEFFEVTYSNFSWHLFCSYQTSQYIKYNYWSIKICHALIITPSLVRKVRVNLNIPKGRSVNLVIC